VTSRVLLVDDDPELCAVIQGAPCLRDFDIAARTSPVEALALLESRDFDVVLTDLQMPAMTGVELCRAILERKPDMPVVVMTSFADVRAAIDAIRAGAHDFLQKPFEPEQLAVRLEAALQYRGLGEELARLRTAARVAPKFDGIVGESGAMLKVFDLIRRVAETDASVLISGESGTGKELVARALHERSSRNTGPYVAINCAAMPESLLESELFGHMKGAFTDAHSTRTGLFVKANKGTLFLDEIGEMPLGMQAKLLRALQERTVRPVGGNDEVPFDTRVLAATNRDLEADVAAGRFREDLFYRVNVVKIHVPPLRARGRDVLLLAQHYLARGTSGAADEVRGMSRGAAQALLRYSWPGNVRELQNCVERAVALARFDRIGFDDLPDRIQQTSTPTLGPSSPEAEAMLPLEEVERRYILHVLDAVGGNKTLAARLLGFDRRTLYRKLEAFGVAPKGSATSDAAPALTDSEPTIESAAPVTDATAATIAAPPMPADDAALDPALVPGSPPLPSPSASPPPSPPHLEPAPVEMLAAPDE